MKPTNDLVPQWWISCSVLCPSITQPATAPVSCHRSWRRPTKPLPARYVLPTLVASSVELVRLIICGIIWSAGIKAGGNGNKGPLLRCEGMGALFSSSEVIIRKTWENTNHYCSILLFLKCWCIYIKIFGATGVKETWLALILISVYHKMTSPLTFFSFFLKNLLPM